ncbi:FAD-binding oxidoreductase [Williamsia deligens]|uniref:FAD-binding oxidoreductase n=1 Tax=Williamsia deligens TaxID=321325 RepID=A0ABW3GAE7_9NOCA|nr:FAD-binding oxidoreductase [Williamsia deligens]MCP2195800.1 Ferredoxin-NADP reductase [Williamsia deligens]
MTTWRVATVVGAVTESPTARSIWLHVPGLPVPRAGQHIDIRLTAPDGYSTSRSYSLSDVREGETVAVSVEELDAHGDVSPFLVRDLEIGEQVEVAGPVGMQFVWPPTDSDASRPVQLIAGGSGIAPLMSMVRLREAAHPATPMRLLYATRSPEHAFYRDEFALLDRTGRLSVDWFYSRSAPPGAPREPGRITRDEFFTAILPREREPLFYLCGGNAYVEMLGDWLLEAGYPIGDIRIERFLVT